MVDTMLYPVPLHRRPGVCMLMLYIPLSRSQDGMEGYMLGWCTGWLHALHGVHPVTIMGAYTPYVVVVYIGRALVAPT